MTTANIAQNAARTPAQFTAAGEPLYLLATRAAFNDAETFASNLRTGTNNVRVLLCDNARDWDVLADAETAALETLHAFYRSFTAAKRPNGNPNAAQGRDLTHAALEMLRVAGLNRPTRDELSVSYGYAFVVGLLPREWEGKVTAETMHAAVCDGLLAYAATQRTVLDVPAGMERYASGDSLPVGVTLSAPEPPCEHEATHEVERRCDDCGGDGYTETDDYDPERGPVLYRTTCQTCEGTGEVVVWECDNCAEYVGEATATAHSPALT